MQTKFLLICFLVVYLKNVRGQPDVLEADYFLNSECYSDYKCSIHVPPEYRNCTIYFRNYNNVRILYAENSDPIIHSTHVSMNIQIVYTKTYVWFRTAGERFERVKRSEIEPAKKIRQLRTTNDINDFANCLYYTNLQDSYQSEINCNWPSKNITEINDLNTRPEEVKSQFKYLNLSGKKIKNFSNLQSTLSYQLLRVNLIDTKIENHPLNFLLDFKNVHLLDLPDSLFEHKVVTLFKQLPKLGMIVTPATIYWRRWDSKDFEMFDRKTRCFLLVSLTDENRRSNGCLANRTEALRDKLNFYLMRESTVHVAIVDYGREAVVVGLGSLILISILLLFRCCKKSA